MSALRGGIIAVLLVLTAAPAAAQDTARVRVDTLPPTTDTIAPATDAVASADSAAAASAERPGPMGAFFRSFLLPGWGQAALGRRTAAGVFVAVEGVTLAMTVKTMREVAYLERTGSARLDGKKQQREDWLVLLAFNHLLSGLEAYVSAQLWDFPGDLQVRRVPGGTAAQVSLPLRIR